MLLYPRLALVDTVDTDIKHLLKIATPGSVTIPPIRLKVSLIRPNNLQIETQIAKNRCKIIVKACFR